MKKSILILATLLVISSISVAGNANQDSNKKSILETRTNLGISLNTAVNDLKKGFKTTDNTLTTYEAYTNNMKSLAKKLKDRSDTEEANPTVLIHGSVDIPNCTYSTDNLVWENSRWKCQKADYEADCIQSIGETRTCVNGVCTCSQAGTYTNEAAGMGVCEEPAGEKSTQVKCIFTNSKSNQEYQVNENLCSNDITILEEPCGSALCSSSQTYDEAYSRCIPTSCSYGRTSTGDCMPNPTPTCLPTHELSNGVCVLKTCSLGTKMTSSGCVAFTCPSPNEAIGVGGCICLYGRYITGGCRPKPTCPPGTSPVYIGFPSHMECM